MSSSAALEWKFSQVFGEQSPGEKVDDVDFISAVEFESRGDYLVAGDHGGRIILFERTDGTNLHPRKELEHMDYPATVHPRYFYKTEFQSHELEFDYLKSLEIGEKINKLRFCATPNNSLFILSTNDRTIKLWKVSECKVKRVKEMELSPNVSSENALLSGKSFVAGLNESSIQNGYHLEWIDKKPRSVSPAPEEGPNTIFNVGESSVARCRRVYAHAHDYNINSISNNSDGETFISADDLRINLWNMEVSNRCFNIVDLKPLDMEDLIDYCNLLAYSSSRGFIRLVDMRQSALCDQNAKILLDHEARGSRSFFTEIIASISDIKFAKDGRHILSRDYMNLKLWDLHMESSPIAIFKINEYLRPKLSVLYNHDAIFDKFECCISRDGHHFASGSYSNIFKVFSHDGGQDDGITLEASRNPNRVSHCRTATRTAGLLGSFACGLNRRGHDNTGSDASDEIPCNLKSKLIHLAWHPTTSLIACATKCSLYMYYA
ncbi:serine/threonine protein phosphatase 2A 55 kDa regulatory subunit B beta isoform-like isoform X2 [Phoenix dactylifera]|uniref:Serine/threonine-protein phosphatase 2A 55 kDa regulatory subunit B n=1 Tax=Phoenix dactylifera TaxID=42345 RepID=A0A8B8ZRE5_PHODC|nr:serine/threonine protein phosphatase 2A 55 kDa regulatory subunit B beta isoform-like isoform X2 [Phoenix dactylifera]